MLVVNKELKCSSYIFSPMISRHVCFTNLYAEEREKPELLAESATRRKRIAQESGKTEQQVFKEGAQQ